MAQTDVTILLKLKDQMSKELGKVGGNVSKANNKFEALGKTLGVGLKIASGVAIASIGAIGATMALSIKKASESQKEMQMVMNTLKNTSEETGISFDELSTKTKELSQQMLQLGYDDEDTAKSFARLTQVTKDTALGQDYLNATMDLARARNLDLETATTQMILAMQGSGRVLKQFGIDVEDGATKAEILSAVQAKVAGQAESYANTFVGSQERMKVAIDNLWERIGMFLLPAVTELATKFSDLVVAFQNSTAIDQTANKIRELWSRLIEVWETIQQKVRPEWDIMVGSIKSMFKELGTLNINWASLGKILLGAIVIALKVVMVAIATLAETIKSMKPALQAFADMWNGLYNIFRKVVDVIKQVVEWTKKIDLKKLSSAGGGGSWGGGKAVGGIVTPSRTYMVGERGAELFQPMTTGKIIPNNQLQSGGGNPITLNVNVGVYAGTETEKRNIAESLYKGLVQLAGMQNKSVSQLLGA